MFNKICHIISTVGFTGYIPVAPGTFGSIIGFLLVLALRPDNLTLVLVLAPLFLIGLIASGETEKFLGKDSGHIVIDELCGYFVSVLFVPQVPVYLIAALVLFRIFDIAKPFHINRIEGFFRGGAGIMLDDIAAGIYANVCLQIIIYLRP